MRTPTRPAALVIALATAAAVSACSHDAKKAQPSQSSTTPVSASPTPTPPSPNEQLATLAAVARHTRYTATYRLIQHGKAVATVKLAVGSAGYTYAITQGRATSAFVSNRHGSYSCQLDAHSRVCYIVARPGKQPPAVFDPALTHVFVDYPTILARNASSYTVSVTGRRPAVGGAGPSTCFAILATGSTPKPRAFDGTYCLSTSGVLSEVVTHAGQLRLVRTGPAPSAAAIVPPVKPTPLPKH